MASTSREHTATVPRNDVIGEFPLEQLESSWWMTHKRHFLLVCVGLVVLGAGLVGVAVYRRRRTCHSDEDSAVDVDAGDAGCWTGGRGSVQTQENMSR